MGIAEYDLIPRFQKKRHDQHRRRIDNGKLYEDDYFGFVRVNLNLRGRCDIMSREYNSPKTSSFPIYIVCYVSLRRW